MSKTKAEVEYELQQIKSQNTKFEKQIQELTNEVGNQRIEKQNISDALKSKELEIQELRKQKNVIDSSQNVEFNRLIDENQQLSTRIKELEAVEKRRVDELNTYIYMHDSLLKSIQGSVNSASLLSEKMRVEVMKE